MKETWAKIFGTENEEKYAAKYQESIEYIALERIKANPYQPRENFDMEKIKELSQSIKTYGLLQPVIVKYCKNEDIYMLIAGERRYMACKKLGWKTIPAVLKEITDSGMAAVALIENLQRENLHFMEEALGYQKLINNFGLTQEVLGKNQSTIANKLRLLKISDKIKESIIQAQMTERHARALLRLSDAKSQEEVVKIIYQQNLNVNETEELVEEYLERTSEEETAGGDEGEDRERGTLPGRRKKKVVIRDMRIFLNTIRQAVKAIKKAGLKPIVLENESSSYYEILIRLPKKVD